MGKNANKKTKQNRNGDETMIKIFEAFAGYGTSSFALKQLGVEHELVGFSEIDKYAIECFKNNHCTKSLLDDWYAPLNYGDITKINWSEVPDFDLLTGGFPCQAFSTAGKQKGEADARGVLGLELTRALIEKQPKYFLFENVKGFMSKRFKETREKFVQSWVDAGYSVTYKVLNTKDFGVPQNRERVWFVGIRKDINKDFSFPEPFELKLKLKDVLEHNVDEKYFLKKEQVEKLFKHLKQQKEKGNSFGVDALPMDVNKSSRCLSARDYKQPKCISTYRHSYLGFKGYDNISVSLKSSEGSGNQALVIDRSKCVCNEGKDSMVYDGQVRRLTPKECFRLQGFLNDEVNLEGLSDTQKYKLAGNGQSVNVVKLLLKELLQGHKP